MVCEGELAATPWDLVTDTTFVRGPYLQSVMGDVALGLGLGAEAVAPRPRGPAIAGPSAKWICDPPFGTSNHSRCQLYWRWEACFPPFLRRHWIRRRCPSPPHRR